MSRPIIDKDISLDPDTALSGERAHQAIWDYIRRRRSFTIEGVWKKLNISRRTIIAYLSRLERGEYVTKPAGEVARGNWHLVRDIGLHAPRLNAQGKPVKENAGLRNMWNSMRGLREFSPAEIAAHSSTQDVEVTLQAAKSYCTFLMKAGYLRVLQKARPPQVLARYRLVDDTGPKPPQIQRVPQVFDPNTCTVRYREVDRT